MRCVDWTRATAAAGLTVSALCSTSMTRCCSSFPLRWKRTRCPRSRRSYSDRRKCSATKWRLTGYGSGVRRTADLTGLRCTNRRGKMLSPSQTLGFDTSSQDIVLKKDEEEYSVREFLCATCDTLIFSV